MFEGCVELIIKDEELNDSVGTGGFVWELDELGSVMGDGNGALDELVDSIGRG